MRVEESEEEVHVCGGEKKVEKKRKRKTRMDKN